MYQHSGSEASQRAHCLRLTLFMLACLAGCIGDPREDPCRQNGARPSGCDVDDASEPVQSSDAALDAALDAELDAAADAEPDALVGQPGDAGPGPRDASVRRDAAADARVDGSAGPRDASSEDAVVPGVPRVLALRGDLNAHDPAIIATGNGYVVFSTGPGIRVKRSADLLSWVDNGRVFQTNPSWIANMVPGATDLWAPDIAYFNGRYHLYYSASTFGSRDSCIGHASATDLTVMDFVDHGAIICTEEADDYNAIDPAFILDEAGNPWLSFGSFWSGIQLIALNDDGGRSGLTVYGIASRAEQAIEAPYIVRRDGYYYLFASFDLCCRGSASTYRIMVGRSPTLAGPYVDANGIAMLSAGGGTQVVVGDERWRGPGHNSVITVGSDQYLVYHAYDSTHGGAATLRISELLWDEAGWPIPAGP